MGVTILQPYPLSDGKSGVQVVEHLSRRLLTLGAMHTGQFLVDCETFILLPQLGATTRAVHILHNSEYPVSAFAIIDNGTGKQLPLIADNMFDLLMLKLNTSFASKKQTKIESRGPRYLYGDFIIKLGSVTTVDHFKGILIEIEYRPSVMLSYCWEMIRETLQGLIGFNVSKEYPTYFTTQTIINAIGQQQLHPKQNDLYDAQDTMGQYLEQFTNYRKHLHIHMPLQNAIQMQNVTGVRTGP